MEDMKQREVTGKQGNITGNTQNITTAHLWKCFISNLLHAHNIGRKTGKK